MLAHHKLVPVIGPTVLTPTCRQNTTPSREVSYIAHHIRRRNRAQDRVLHLVQISNQLECHIVLQNGEKSVLSFPELRCQRGDVTESSTFWSFQGQRDSGEIGSLIVAAAFILNDSQNEIIHRRTTTHNSESPLPNIEVIIHLHLPFIHIGFLAVQVVTLYPDRQMAYTLPSSYRRLRSILENNTGSNGCIV